MISDTLMGIKMLLIPLIVLALTNISGAVDLSTPTGWVEELKNKPAKEGLALIYDHSEQWPQLRSLSWINRQDPQAQLTHKDDIALSIIVLTFLRSVMERDEFGQQDLLNVLTQLISIADNCKKKGGHDNDVVALACERVAIHLTLVHVYSTPSNVAQLATLFKADSSSHIKTKEWLKQRGNEDAWLHSKMDRIESISDADEKAPFGIYFRLAQGETVPVPGDFSFRSLIDSSNVVRLHFEIVNTEFVRTVAIPLIIDYVTAGGQLTPRPTNPAQAVKERLGSDMSKYKHNLLRSGNASANDIWSTLNQVANEPVARARLVRWLD